MTVRHRERQPARPRWLPLALETEVDRERLRFRMVRRGRWRETPFSDIQTAEAVRLGVWSWPVGYKLSSGVRKPIAPSAARPCVCASIQVAS